MPMKTLNTQSLLRHRVRRQRGFTLLEVMVALVIFSIGLLGLADLQIRSVDYNNGAYLRSQASFLISDMMDRMRANKNAALTNFSQTYNLQSGTNISSTTCDGTSANCGATAQAKADLYAWIQALKVLPGGTGTISMNGSGTTSQFTVSVSWNDKYSSTGTSTLSVTGEL